MGMFSELLGLGRTVTVRAVGVTFNTGKKPRQELLRALKFGNKPFKGNVWVSLVDYEYEGEPAIAVCVNDIQVGNISRNDLPMLLNNVKEVRNIEVIGGRTVAFRESSYGLELTLLLKR